MKKLLLLLSLLLTFKLSAQLTVYPVSSVAGNCSHSTGCPGGYCGYLVYIPTNGDWGFKPIAGQSIYSATDINTNNTKIQEGGLFGDNGCSMTTVLIAAPPFSSQYRFGVYFTNKLQFQQATNLGMHPIVLTNFVE